MLSRDRIIRKSIRTRYLVTLETEETFRGVLVDADDRTLVFANVEQIQGNGRAEPLDGQVWIPRNHVKYLQTTTS